MKKNAMIVIIILILAVVIISFEPSSLMSGKKAYKDNMKLDINIKMNTKQTIRIANKKIKILDSYYSKGQEELHTGIEFNKGFDFDSEIEVSLALKDGTIIDVRTIVVGDGLLKKFEHTWFKDISLEDIDSYIFRSGKDQVSVRIDGEERNEQTSELENAKYVVSLSKQLEEDAKLLFLDKEGVLFGEYEYEGLGIKYIEAFQGKLYMYSKRSNSHYKFDETGNVSEISLRGDEYKDESTGVWFVSRGEHSLIESMNMGYVNNEYLSNILYELRDKKREVIFKDTVLVDAVEDKDKIFVKCYSDIYAKTGGICVVDKENGSKSKLYTFEDKFVANGIEKLLVYNNQIISYGSKSVSGIGAFDTKTYTTKSIVLEDNEIILFMYIYDGLLHVVTNNNNRYQYNESLEVMQKESIENGVFMSYFQDENLYIARVIEEKELVHLVYGSLNFDDKENLGFIQVYRKRDMATVDTVPIINPKAKKWMGEHLDVALIE